MKSNTLLRHLLLLVGSSVMTVSSAHAASGSWNINSGGDWTDITKWTGGLDYASGTDSTATFNNVIDADRIINLNTGITIGHISVLEAGSNYTISGGNILTLDTNTGIPSISVGTASRTLTISSEIQGNDGLEKIGGGVLLLSGSNSYTGGTTLTAGTLSIGHNNALSTGTLTLGSANFRSSDATARTMSNLVTVLGSDGTDTNFTGTGNLTFTNTGDSSLGGSGTRAFNVADGITVTFAQTFSGSAGILKKTTGTLKLTGESSYTGVTTIGGASAGGILEISTIRDVNGGNSSIGNPNSTANGIIGIRNSTLKYVGTGNETNRQISNAGIGATSTIDQSGTGLLKFTASNFWGSTLGGGTMTLKLQGSTVGTGEISGAISNGGRTVTVTKDGTGTWTLSGANSYTGITTLTDGILSVATIGNGGVAGNLGQATNVATNIVFNGGTLQYTGANATSDRAFTINANKTATINTTNDISFAGATGTATNGNLTKTGAGKLTLTAANTYTGTTTISTGTLALGASGTFDSTSGVVLGGGTFDVSAKASYSVANLSGNGSVAGTLNVTTSLKMGGDTNAATINFANLALSSGTTAVFDLTGGATAADLGDVSGTLDLASATLDLVQLGAYTTGNKFTLFAYDGILSNTFSGLIDGAIFNDAGGDWQINYDDNSAGLNGGTGSFYVTVAAIPEPSTALLGGLGTLMLLRRRRLI